ncbi:MAG TPA: hypothetical protein VM491_23380, partial [Burkholderiaceae bacterium]|nr:hypothetical protein [Burkholderiaceae bacterium]
MTLHDIELALEEEAVEVARRNYRELLKHGLTDQNPGRELIRRTIGAVIEAITSWQEDATSGKAGRSIGLARFLAQYDADEVALIALRAVTSACSSREAKLTATAMSIMADLEQIDLIERLREANKQVYLRFVRSTRGRGSRLSADRKLAILRRQFQYVGTFNASTEFTWTASERLQVGVRLIEIIKETTGLIEIVKADVGARHHVTVIRPSADVEAWLKAAQETCAGARPQFYPMVIPPLPWRGAYGGGYLRPARGQKQALMKFAAGGHRVELQNSSLAPVCAAVNAIQETP